MKEYSKPYPWEINPYPIDESWPPLVKRWFSKFIAHGKEKVAPSPPIFPPSSKEIFSGLFNFYKLCEESPVVWKNDLGTVVLELPPKGVRELWMNMHVPSEDEYVSKGKIVNSSLERFEVGRPYLFLRVEYWRDHVDEGDAVMSSIKGFTDWWSSKCIYSSYNNTEERGGDIYIMIPYQVSSSYVRFLFMNVALSCSQNKTLSAFEKIMDATSTHPYFDYSVWEMDYTLPASEFKGNKCWASIFELPIDYSPLSQWMNWTSSPF